MTYENLFQFLSQMTPEQRTRPAIIADELTGSCVEIKKIQPIASFNDRNLPDQFVMRGDGNKVPKVF